MYLACINHLTKYRRLPSVMLVGCIQLVEGLTSTNWSFLKKKFCLKIKAPTPAQVSNLIYKFQTCQPPQFCGLIPWNKSNNISDWFCFSGQPWLVQLLYPTLKSILLLFLPNKILNFIAGYLANQNK